MNRCIPAAVAAVIASGALLAAGCGGEDDADEAANSTDRAFAEAMVPHHEMAVEMAEIAERRGEHPQVQRLAGEMIETQTSEIETLRQINDELKADDVEQGDLGIPERTTGMGGNMPMLEGVSQFDRAFIAMMVPHHEGAIRMARVELAEGEDPRLRDMAAGIIDAQQGKIDQMRSWSKDWYGEAPATGRNEGHMGGAGMDHMGHGEGL